MAMLNNQRVYIPATARCEAKPQHLRYMSEHPPPITSHILRGACLQMQSNLIHDMNLHGCVGIVRKVCLLVNTPMTSGDYKLQLTGPCWHVIMSYCVATMRSMWMILKMMILNLN